MSISASILGPLAVPVDVGVDAADDPALHERLDSAADAVGREVHVAGDLLVAGTAVRLEEAKDSHVCLVEAAVSTEIGFGTHPVPDYGDMVELQAAKEIPIGRTAGRGRVEERLRALGIALPRPPLPIGTFAPARIVGELVFVSGVYGTCPNEKTTMRERTNS
jgi:hypothetical protein